VDLGRKGLPLPEEKKNAGAAMDLLGKEAPGKENPFFSLDNVILSTHNSGISCNSKQLLFRMSVGEIIRNTTGKAPACRVH